MSFIYDMYRSFELVDRITYHKRDIELLEKRIKMHKEALDQLGKYKRPSSILSCNKS